MKIWQISYDYDNEHNNQFVLCNKEKVFLQRFEKCMYNDIKVKEDFDGLEIERISGDKTCDFPKLWYAMTTLMCSKKAKDLLQNLIDNDVEFIPTKCNEDELYIIHTLHYKDAVDHDSSEIRSLSSGLEVEYLSYSFIEEKIENANIFKVLLNNNHYTTKIFVTSEFKDIVEQNGLTGIKFTEVWNSDD